MDAHNEAPLDSDPLLKAALNKVNEAVSQIHEAREYNGNEIDQRATAIARAVHAVDALKSSLKVLPPSRPMTEAERKDKEARYHAMCDAIRQHSEAEYNARVAKGEIHIVKSTTNHVPIPGL